MDDVSATFEWITEQGPLGPKLLFSEDESMWLGQNPEAEGTKLRWPSVFLVYIY